MTAFIGSRHGWFVERFGQHIRPEVLALATREAPITGDEWKNFRGNSYEMHIIAPRLDDEAFAYYAEHNLANCFRADRSTPYSTYDDALVGFVAPELLRRWRATFGAKAPADTIALSRAEASLLLEALRHLPDFTDDGSGEAMIERLSAFLYPKTELEL